MLSTWVICAGGTRQARSLPLAATSVKTSRDRMHVPARGLTQIPEQFLEHQDVQHADSQASPVRALVGSEPIHGRVGPQPRQQPLTIGHGSKAEKVLLGIAFDGFPGRAAACFARTRRAAPQTRVQAVASSSRAVRPGYPETRRCVGKINSPGSLMPTSIIRQN